MAVDPSIAAQVYELLSDPMSLPPAFWNYATQSWLKDSPVFPISQVFGFTQFTAQVGNYIDTLETLAVNGAYTALATDGPAITGLPDGHYVFFFGSISTGGSNNYMGLRVNGTDPSDSDTCYLPVGAGGTTPNTRAVVYALSNNGNNTVVCRYKTDSQPATFRKRWLIALKYANN